MAGAASRPLEIPARTTVIRDHKQRGGRVAAVFPVHQPRALFRAFDILPVEVWGPPGIATTGGDSHLQGYTCSIVRSGLAFLLSGGLEVADFLVVPHACDSLQGLGSILLDFIKPDQPVVPVYPPRGDGDAAVDFFSAELRSVFERLAAATGIRPSDGELMAAIYREEEADALLARLDAERATLTLGERDLYRLLRSREYLPAETFATLASRALGDCIDVARTGIPVILSGIVPEPMEILDLIADGGGTVAADDLACCGRRLYPPGTSSDPFQRMAESILGGPPDPTRGSSVEARSEHLRRLAARTGARAIVFYLVKFCEPELFYLPLVRRALEQAGIRSQTVEVDLADPLSRQVATRVEALLEMVA
ncbi:MAG: 2-hydroxyacyl-CoA dehydratase [bacterium]|nr:2-hydroxyacyl-CoA dehydratase [bacterium]